MLRAIYVEDEEDDRLDEGFCGVLADCWNVHSDFGRIEIEALDFPEARRRLQDDPDAVQLYLVDLLDRRTGTTPGLQLIESASRRSAAAIVAISEVDDELDEARHQGAHEAIRKKSVSRKPKATYDRLLNALRGAGVSLGAVDDITVDWDRDDIQISSVAETIGADTVKQLLAALVRDIRGATRLDFVRPGLSGAVVVHCDCTLESATGPGRRQVILKAARDRASMEAELGRWPETTRFQSGLFPTLAHEALAAASGWHGLAISHFPGVTLTSWLQEDDETADVDRVLSQLWLSDGLARAYEDSSPEQKEGQRPTAAIHDGVLPLGRRARVMLACEQLEPLARRHAGATDEMFASVHTFLKHGTFAGIDRDDAPSGCWVVRTHGDLHGRNLLVNQYGTVKLIDPASIDARHWAIDYARLTVDILLVALARDPAGHEWERMGDWKSLAAEVVAGDPPAETELLPPRAAAALRWLANKRGQIFAAVGNQGALPVEWELQLTLAAELLRAAYRVEELPSPVRVLGLVAGAAALTTAAATRGADT